MHFGSKEDINNAEPQKFICDIIGIIFNSENGKIILLHKASIRLHITNEPKNPEAPQCKYFSFDQFS